VLTEDGQAELAWMALTEWSVRNVTHHHANDGRLRQTDRQTDTEQITTTTDLI